MQSWTRPAHETVAGFKVFATLADHLTSTP
jgi:hypothetical protein